MWNSLVLSPILASGLALAFARGTLAAGDSAAVGVASNAATVADIENSDSYHSVYDYAGHAVFTVNYTGAAASDVPVYVKVSEDAPKGFRYHDLKNGREDLRFFDSTGKSLDYEIVEWNPNGTSRFWMCMPVVRQGATITMCWNLRDGCTLPPLGAPKRVWLDFVGVWHMDETITSATAETTLSADATGNGLDMTPRVGPEGVYTTMTSVQGVFDKARVNDTSARNKKQGSYLEIPNRDDFLKFNGAFTLSFWIKFDGYANYPQLASRRNDAQGNVGFQIDINLADRKQLIARGDTQTGSYQNIVDQNFADLGFTHLAFVYDGPKVSIYANGVCKVREMEIGKASDNDLPIAIGNKNGGTDQSVWGKYDEVRLYKGVRSAEFLAADCAVGNDPSFLTAGAAVNDPTAVLKNHWLSEPTISRTTWELPSYPSLDDFDINPAHGKGNEIIVFYNRQTGEELGEAVPRGVGEYRAVIFVPEQGGWGSLEYELNFRIVERQSEHAFGINVDRILLANDDYSVEGGAVEYQSYDAESDEDALFGVQGLAFWHHLEDDHRTDASTTYRWDEVTQTWVADEDTWSVSTRFNLGGGTYHVYGYTNAPLWTLMGVRIGNTFNNGAFAPEETWDQGLRTDQNYLPWNPEAQRVLNGSFSPIEGFHRYAAHLVLQNKCNAYVASSLYTNGVGTIYFDAVNGWTGNLFDKDGQSNYRLIVEIATNRLNSVKLPTDEAISSNPEMGIHAYDPMLYADWKTVPMRVLHFHGTRPEDYDDLGMTNVLDLAVEEGGSYTNFYRVIVPVNTLRPARFRIRRVTIDSGLTYDPDGDAYVLLDNVICSTPTVQVNLEPYGRYDATKTGKQVQGWEGAFVPAFPSIRDEAVYGRAKATLANGADVPSDAISAASMHYRWRYLEQRETAWRSADLDPATLVTMRPLELPALFQGDIEFWFDVNQKSAFYAYADYSGTGFGLGGCGYTEEITSVTNRASGADWFVRTREGKAAYAEMKLFVKTSENAVPEEIGLSVSDNRLWRGYYRMTEALESGIYWRIEARDSQEDGATAWNAQTNCWYVSEWREKLPKFPATGRMFEGTASDWSRVPCDKVTGYLMFQVDESSRGVTVLRADYQNFNDWNDASDYFSISAESNSVRGTSADVQTYDEPYERWPDSQATDPDWALAFTNAEQVIGNKDYPGYVMFPSKKDFFAAWDLGKGMWVYGNYREPTSHVAYQMAGCGEGYAEFIQTTQVGENWPRGLGSVSFNARLAQAIEPQFATYYDEGARLTNYTFMTRVCFDMKQNRGFAGNAALSLFAYYRPGKGMYEARWEQVSGGMTSNPDYPTQALGPLAYGQRLVISRWDPAGDNTYVETNLYVQANGEPTSESVKTFAFNMPMMPWQDGDASTNNLMPFCISVYKDGADTVIAAAVRVRYAKAPKGERSGVACDEAVDGACWQYVCVRDSSDRQLKGGSYGVLSSNCEGLFLRPQFRARPTYPDGDPAVRDGFYTNKQIVNGTDDFTECHDDIVDGWWVVNPGRQELFDATEPRTSRTRTGDYGFSYVKRPQTVDIYTRAPGDGKWSDAPLRSVPIEDFGAPGDALRHVEVFNSTTNCEVRLQTGGDLNTRRTDVVISDVEISQWRGCDAWTTSDKDWNFTKDVRKTGNDFGYTNIVFTSGWVTDGAVTLSTERTEVGSASSIRSPLFDGGYQTGWGYRGVGLGSLTFRYREPPRDINVKIQFVTNYTSNAGTSLKDMSRSLAEGDGNAETWYTVTNLTYKALMDSDCWDSGRQEGEWTTRLGLHGVHGMMRLVVEEGALDVLEFVCRDEPALDKGCWWGWNLRTVGNLYDSQKRMYLPDVGLSSSAAGQSMALNNSTTDDTNPKDDPSSFRQHLPFVQSPTFSAAVVGQISFKARKYDLSDRAPDAKVVVYGATDYPDYMPRDDQWTLVGEFPVTNTIYSTYTCKTEGEKYYALRLAVLIDGTLYPPEEAAAVTSPQRVLIDEVTVSEAVSALLVFRNVGAFRSNLKKNVYVEGVTTKEEQPLCNENWGVQAELMAAMLADEIDLTTPPRVKLHWYVGERPWGFEKWKACESGCAPLAQTEGSNLVYRSSYEAAPSAVMPAQTVPGTVVQYMLEVEYDTIRSEQGEVKHGVATNWLDAAAWSSPDWYAPLDFNADANHGDGKTFAGYTILDSVAPGWAWINEANVFGDWVSGYKNSDQEFQYVELCVPMEADLTGWSVRLLSVDPFGSTVVTNSVAYFGTPEFTAKKSGNVGAASGKVFRCVGNKASAKMRKTDGTLDGVWAFDGEALGGIFEYKNGTYYVDAETPFGIQLLRPSGIIEHSIVTVGTNAFSRYVTEYDETNIVAKLNALVPGSKFFFAGSDHMGPAYSDSVTSGQAEDASRWTNDWACSPGRINTNFTGAVQQIGQHPTPSGDSILVYASVDWSNGPIRQYVGGKGSSMTNVTEMFVLQRGGPGTNIVYEAGAWYEVANVSTNGATAWAPGPQRASTLSFWVGKNASNNLSVVASAMVDRELRTKYGLDEKNAYTPAVMDWLVNGKDAHDKPFANPGSVALADFMTLRGNIVTNLTLTQMYWLDMDPTVSNLVLKAGLHKPTLVPVSVGGGQPAITNVQLKMFMMISNRTDGTAWSPYVTRGLEPGYTSWDYSDSAPAWTSVTFKITGRLINGRTDWRNKEQWVPLRWFVFRPDSFYQPVDEPDHARFTTEIEIVDPHIKSSPGYEAGWYDWCEEFGRVPVYNSWSIDGRLRPVGVEILHENNYYPHESVEE